MVELSESIKISKELKQNLDRLKILPRESYNDAIESLISTLEVTMNQKLVKEIKKSLDNFKDRRYKKN